MRPKKGHWYIIETDRGYTVEAECYGYAKVAKQWLFDDHQGWDHYIDLCKVGKEIKKGRTKIMNKSEFKEWYRDRGGIYPESPYQIDNAFKAYRRGLADMEEKKAHENGDFSKYIKWVRKDNK